MQGKNLDFGFQTKVSDTTDIELVANQSIEEMDLVEIRSHDAP